MKVPIRIYNRFLDLKSEIDTYQSLQYGRSYHSVADFELHVNRYMHEAQKINKGDIIALDKQANKAGIILAKEIVLDEKGRESENFKLTGYTLDGLMFRRITVPPSHTGYDRKSGNAETVMKHYVYNHFINPANRDRIMPHLEVAPNYNRGDYIEWESRYKNVAEELENISVKSGLGWGIFANFKTKKLIFDVIIAKDLTQDNPYGNNPVFFSPEFETIKSQSFIDSDNDFKTVGYVGGQGEGIERKIVTLGNKTGWERIETFIDARDIGAEDEELEEELTDEEIEQRLIERGKSKMAEMENIRSLEAEILTPVKDITPFQYEKDFDLGDIVQVVNKSWGLEMTAPITEFKEIHEPGGFRLEATFGRSVPLFTDKIKREFDELNGVEKQELPAQIAVETKRYTDHKVSKEEQERIKQSEENLKASKEFTEKYAEKKRVKSPTEPVDKDVIWIDTSNPNEVWKVWKESEGAWSPLYDPEIGGRNLLRGTQKEVKTIASSGWGDVSHPDGLDLLEKGVLQKGETYTFRVYLESDSYPVRCYVRIPNDSTPYRDFRGNSIPANSKGYSSVTFTVPDDAIDATAFVIRFDQRDTPTQQVGYGEEKLEKGNVATDWTPAPEDQEAYAEYIAQLKADLAEEEAKAHADGKVTEEEQARINDVKEKLEQAKQHANQASSEAEQKAKNHANSVSTKAYDDALKDAKAYMNNNGVMQGKNYNGVSITNADGFVTARSDGLVRTINNSTYGIAVQRRKSVTSPWENIFYVDDKGNVTFAGVLDGVVGTFGEVTVKNGNFMIRDDNSSTDYKVTPIMNMIGDHSFEKVDHDIYVDEKLNWSDMIEPKIVDYRVHQPYWRMRGTPKVASISNYGVKDRRALPIYQDKAIVVKDANFVYQYISQGIGSGIKYTLSGYFKRHWGQTPGKPRFEIDHMRSGNMVKRLFNKVFPTVPNDYRVVRHDLTFDVSDFQPGDYLYLKLSGGDSNWVQCDGIQLVEGDKPTIYMPQEDVHNLYKELYDQQALWTGAIYLLDSHKIYPSKPLLSCRNGWVLRWSYYVPGEGARNSDWQSTYVPKRAAYNNGGHRTGLRVGSDNKDIVKYYYVYNEYIQGHKVNGGDNRSLCLREVAEF